MAVLCRLLIIVIFALCGAAGADADAQGKFLAGEPEVGAWQELKQIVGMYAKAAGAEVREFFSGVKKAGLIGILMIAVAVVCLFVVGLAGIVVGPLMIAIGAIALVVAIVGQVAIEGMTFSIAKPMVGIIAGSLWLGFSVLCWIAFIEIREENNIKRELGLFYVFCTIAAIMAWVAVNASAVIVVALLVYMGLIAMGASKHIENLGLWAAGFASFSLSLDRDVFFYPLALVFILAVISPIRELYEAETEYGEVATDDEENKAAGKRLLVGARKGAFAGLGLVWAILFSIIDLLYGDKWVFAGIVFVVVLFGMWTQVIKVYENKGMVAAVVEFGRLAVIGLFLLAVIAKMAGFRL